MMSSYLLPLIFVPIPPVFRPGRVDTQFLLKHGHQFGSHVLFTPVDALLFRTIGIADGSLECGSFLCEDEFAAMRRVRRLDPEGQGGGNPIWTPPAAVISVAEPIDFSCQPAQGKI